MNEVPAQCSSPTSSFAAIRDHLFKAEGCTAGACHGVAASGGLRLDADDHLYDALVGTKSQNSAFDRVTPRSPDESFLYLKLRAATEPGSVAVAGSPMPIGRPTISPGALEALKVWIEAGAPSDGFVTDPADATATTDHVAQLLHACGAAPDAPVDAGPQPDGELVPPPAGIGVQLRMPPYQIGAASEWEGCFASYYDLSDQVPQAFRTPDGNGFYVKGTEIRQDAGSHHLVIMHSGFLIDRIDDPTFGAWSCRGGDRVGTACDPKDSGSCGADGFCTSASADGTACIGFGPLGSSADPSAFGLGTALQSTVVVEPIEGVFREVPIRGIVYWNLHAFNLTDEARTQHARLNLLFTDDLRMQETHESIPGTIPPVAPFTKQDVCETWDVPADAQIIRLTSHTHRHGERFWILDPAGNKIYESFDYGDPAYIVFDPPLMFGGQTMKFCATFNNGLRDDGTFDIEHVSRKSRVPSYAFSSCDATACTAGKIGAPCGTFAGLLSGVNAECDSVSGKGDGVCDACPLVFGQTTEQEMFFMIPDTIRPAN
jgi:hypothetical protein